MSWTSPLDGGHQDGAVLAAASLVGFHVWLEVGHCLLHHAGALDHLGQEHLAGPEQVAHHAHSVHQRTFDHLEGAGEALAALLGVGLDVLNDALDEGVLEALAHRPAAPFGLGLLGPAGAGRLPDRLGEVYQPLGGVGAAEQQHVFDPLQEVRGDLLVDAEHPGVDDAEVQPVLDGVIEEGGVHGFAHAVVATEREGHVADAADHVGVGAGLLDLGAGLDEGQSVEVVLLDAGGHRQHVGVEDDVLGREAHLVHQDAVGPRAHGHLALQGVGLTVLVEGHADRGRAVAAHQTGSALELQLAVLETDGVDHRLALQALESGLQHLPARGVNHDRNTADVGLRGDQVQEAGHGGHGVDHALVHVDVQQVGPAFHLLAGHCQRFFQLLGPHHLGELGGAGDVGALANHGESRVPGDGVGLQARQSQHVLGKPRLARRHVPQHPTESLDVVRAGAAAAAHHVEPAVAGELAHDLGHLLGGLIVATKLVGQPGVGVAAQVAVGQVGQLLQIGAHLFGAPERS